jgi:hypothetical protein
LNWDDRTTQAFGNFEEIKHDDQIHHHEIVVWQHHADYYWPPLENNRLPAPSHKQYTIQPANYCPIFHAMLVAILQY